MRSLYLVALLLTLSATARAYPTAVVFSPTGEAKDLGNVQLLAYSSTNLSPGGVTPSASWFGVEGGVLPQWKYADSGVSFGGLELGFDLITPFGKRVKPVFNAKLGAVTEGVWTPSVALGIMEITPYLPSMNYVYGSMTKTLRASPDASSYGRLTLGYGYTTGSGFNGTFPFHNTKSALMACYESPLAYGKVGVAIDYLGGASEISDLYSAVTLALSDSTTVAAGAFFANDRSTPATTYDGVLVYLTTSFDARKVFTH